MPDTARETAGERIAEAVAKALGTSLKHYMARTQAEAIRAAGEALKAEQSDLLAALEEYAGEPCQTEFVDDLEAGCCRGCRARAAIARATGGA